MILHNGLGVPWQLAQGTFTVFSFCKAEGKNPHQLAQSVTGEHLKPDTLLLVIRNGQKAVF